MQLSGTTNSGNEEKPTTYQVFFNQILDSLIVGGIAGFSTYITAGDTAGFKVFGLAFAIAFLFKLKEYRKI
jgi:hypothetical protein